MSTKKETLKSLRKYFLDGGSTDAADVASFLSVDEDTVEGVVAELKKAYPADFGDVEETEPEHKFFLKNADRTTTELEMVKEKNNTIVFVIKEPKDLVDIILKGEKTTVDLHQLRKDTAQPVKGVSPADIIKLAELAKA